MFKIMCLTFITKKISFKINLWHFYVLYHKSVTLNFNNVAVDNREN